jgi:transcriptional regulator with XRE-family HTH domain
MNRSETVETFRQRLNEVIERAGLNRSAFAAELGLDRSTLSQLLSPGNERLPRAETIIAIARLAQVSVDWLLGLSQDEQPSGAQLLENALQIESAAGLPADERLLQWHAEASGYKIRYVPLSLPDLLKTQAVISYEYGLNDERLPALRHEQTEARLAYSRCSETDFEICSSIQSVVGFARGEGLWRDLSTKARRAQLEQMIQLLEELYPSLRWFLFDGRRQFSVPYTLFGPKRAAVYFGNMYFVFNATEQIRVLTRHFEDLIRAATVQPTEVPTLLRQLINNKKQR